MNGDFIINLVIWVSCVYLLISAALIIYSAKVIYDLRKQLRRFSRPAVPRDVNGRPLKERI